jgi:hypothetical protein
MTEHEKRKVWRKFWEDAKGPLAQLVRETKRHSLGLGFDLPVGANFQAKVKRIPSSVPCQNTGLGQGFGVFLDLREKVFFLMQCLGVVLPPAGRVFY